MGKYKFTFIDLFAGIGGFHQAMRFLGGKCVMAAEIDKACVNTYKLNFPKSDIYGDIRNIEPSSIPAFDVLCAGFPCQPFSKAGAQKGFNDAERGNLFYVIMSILDQHDEAKFVLLENVRNLADKNENWDIIKDELLKRNFYITETPIILSPTNFGLPQIRERVYILAIRKDFRNKDVLSNGYIHISDLGLEKNKNKNNCKSNLAWTILEDNVSDDYIITEEQEYMLTAWEEFRIATAIGTIGYPIWISCFGCGIDDTELFYNNINYYDMPKWKKKFVENNRKLYISNREFIDEWVNRCDMLNRIKLYQKFEWNCGTDCKSMREAIIQIRQSGIRVKRPNYFPSLVAIVNTPIIWDRAKSRYRHITPREAANMQNFHAKFKFTGTDDQIYQQLGNTVNVRLIKILGDRLFRLGAWKENDGEKN